jgi:serine/threonine protein kinase
VGRLAAARCRSCFEPIPGSGLCVICSERSQDSTALPVGSKLLDGRYSIGRTLGLPGGFGITYLAWDASLERRVAIKEFYPRQGTYRRTNGVDAYAPSVEAAAEFDAGLEGFLDEARRLAQLDHQNIVKVHDYCAANGTGYLVMSYYEGRDLAEYTQASGGRLPWLEAFEVVTPILDGLSQVHAAGLIHRDIKPANIYLANVDAAKSRSILIDFGAARWASTTHELTSILTEGYAPIEQYPGCGLQGPWTDIYAVAATLHVLIAGELPATAPSRLTGNFVPNLSEMGRGVRRQFADAVEYGLSVDPEARPQSAAEFARLLRAAVQRSSAAASRAGNTVDRTTTPMAGSSARAAAVLADVPQTKQIVPRRASAPESARSRVSGLLAAAMLVLALAGIAGLVWFTVFDKSGSQEAASPASSTSSPPERVDLSARLPANARPSDDRAIAALLDSAGAAYGSAHYGTAMTLLERAHQLANGAAVATQARARLIAAIDSVAGVVHDACEADHEILLRRGEKAAPCKQRAW